MNAPAAPRDFVGLKIKLDRPVDREQPCCRNICTIISTGKLAPTATTDIGHDREWWAEEAARVGSDWSGVMDSAHTLLAIAGLTLAPIDDWGPASFRQLCAEADRTDRRAPPGAVWSAAGRCINRLPPRKALKTFLKWCDQHDVVRTDAMFVFEAIVDKELAK